MEKLKVKLLTLCDMANVSREGKLSLIGIFDRIFVKQTPSSFIRMFLVAMFEGKPDSEYEIQLSIQAPDNKSVLPNKKIKLKIGANGRFNLISDVVNLPLPKIGEYKIQLSLGDKLSEQTTFWVSKTGEKSVEQEEKLPN